MLPFIFPWNRPHGRRNNQGRGVGGLNLWHHYPASFGAELSCPPCNLGLFRGPSLPLWAGKMIGKGRKRKEEGGATVTYCHILWFCPWEEETGWQQLKQKGVAFAGCSHAV